MSAFRGSSDNRRPLAEGAPSNTSRHTPSGARPARRPRASLHRRWWRSARGQRHDNRLSHPALRSDRRYYYQGIGRFAPTAAYARGLADLQVLADLVPPRDYMFGPEPTSIDASIYGFIANIHFYSIETPLKKFVTSRSNLVRHCTAIHRLVGSDPLVFRS